MEHVLLKKYGTRYYEKAAFTTKNLPRLQTPIQVAQKMGAGLGKRKILQRKM